MYQRQIVFSELTYFQNCWETGMLVLPYQSEVKINQVQMNKLMNPKGSRRQFKHDAGSSEHE